MDYRRRFIRIAVALALVAALGTVGYVLIERWSWFDAVYMTFITISTVGFKEVHELSRGGQVFTIFVIVGGTGTMLYTATTFMEYLLEGRFGNILGRRRMRDEISKLKDHVILCGYGKVGQEVARVFQSEDARFVVIESNPEMANKAIDDGCFCIEGDATSDEILRQAGITAARALVTALATDADNLYVTLSAKGLRPELFVVTRVYNEASEVKLKRAGADRTMSPYRIGGRRLAMLTLRPLVADFIDTAMGTRGQHLVFENVVLRQGSAVVGQTIGDWLKQCGGVQILAMKKKDGELTTNLPEQLKLELGDEVVVVGTREQLKSIDPLL